MYCDVLLLINVNIHGWSIFFPSGFPIKNFYSFSSYSIRVPCPAHFTLFDRLDMIRSARCCLSSLVPEFSCQQLFSDTQTQFPFLRIKHHVANPYNITENLCILHLERGVPEVKGSEPDGHKHSLSFICSLFISECNFNEGK